MYDVVVIVSVVDSYFGFNVVFFFVFFT